MIVDGDQFPLSWMLAPKAFPKRDLYKGEFIFKNIPELGLVRVIFNDPCTILYVNGQRYVSRATKDENFDKEKGFLMCFAKAFGLTSSDLSRVVANAIDQKKNESN